MLLSELARRVPMTMVRDGEFIALGSLSSPEPSTLAALYDVNYSPKVRANRNISCVITSGKLPKYSYIPALNEALGKLAARLDTPQQRVIAVNQADGFDWKTDTIEDKVHPNAQGAEKMAARWRVGD